MTNYTYPFRKWSTYLTMQNLSSQFGILSNLTKNKSLFTNPNSKDQYLPEHFRNLVDMYAMTADPFLSNLNMCLCSFHNLLLVADTKK